MVNMTIAVDEEVLRKARIVALEPRHLARFAVVLIDPQLVFRGFVRSRVSRLFFGIA